MRGQPRHPAAEQSIRQECFDFRRHGQKKTGPWPILFTGCVEISTTAPLIAFGSPSGFSGAPLLVDFKLAGMLYGNIDVRLDAYSVLEVDEDGREYRETSSRIYEYGLSHNLGDVLEFIQSCDLSPFALTPN